MTTFEKLPPVDEYRACLCCPPRGRRLSLTTWLCVGFGPVAVTRDEETVYYHVCIDDEGCDQPADRFEAMASRDPDHDWRIDFLSPMRQLVYQRQGIGQWVLVEAGMGFA